VLSASTSSPGAIRIAKDANPHLLVIARAAYASEVSALRAAGADAVVSAEGEVALAMAERLLEDLGATPDQLDRARVRVREAMGSGAHS
jgi:CPA2 family monovalent cation:H+ antiporter-2